MTVRQPEAQPALSPEMACGKAAGKSTALNIPQPRRPRFCPTSMIVGLTLFKPALRLMAVGKVTEQTVTTTSEVGFARMTYGRHPMCTRSLSAIPFKRTRYESGEGTCSSRSG